MMIIFLGGADYNDDDDGLPVHFHQDHNEDADVYLRWGSINLFAALISILIATLVSHSLLRFIIMMIMMLMLMIMIWRMRIMVILIDFDECVGGVRVGDKKDNL